MNKHYYCVILAGGIGSRFWPISRKSRPKQFLEFGVSGKSFLRLAYERALETILPQNILVISLEEYRDQVMEILPELSEENLLLEPFGRNTAPSMAFAACHLLNRDPDAVMLITPSDHIITNIDKYNECIRQAMDMASQNNILLTLGIKPTRPDCNFGYIQIAGGSKAIFEGEPVKAKSFTEKPDSELAKVFLESGEFLWNSGIFIWKAVTILDEILHFLPELGSVWGEQGGDIKKIYSNFPRTSIDYAVMEKSENVWILPAGFGWADIGNWESLYEYLAERDEYDNAKMIAGKSLLKDDARDIIYCENPQKILAIRGLDNFIVVDTKDALLICPRDDSKVKELLSELYKPEFEKYR